VSGSEYNPEVSEALAVRRLAPALNPLTDRHGAWEFEEFLFMAAGVEELRDKKARAASMAVAKEVGMNAEETHDLMLFFRRCDTAGTGTISQKEIKKLLKTSGMRQAERGLQRALRHLRLEQVDDFTFPTFIRIMARLDVEFRRTLDGNEATDDDEAPGPIEGMSHEASSLERTARFEDEKFNQKVSTKSERHTTFVKAATRGSGLSLAD
jgi:hypothetical protein